MSLNCITVMGRLVRDVDVRETADGSPVANFTIAVARDTRDRQTGERLTDFLDVVAFRGSADFAAKFFSKGRMVVVDGRLQIRVWTDKNDIKRQTPEIVANSLYFADSKPDTAQDGFNKNGGAGTSGHGNGGYGAPPSAQPAQQTFNATPLMGPWGAEVDMDEELPFL